ncbi:MAG: DUF2062 domain-containing protein [Planctomycetaceae bacterium]|nr:DUF2062 domain-containing protein [Planctomycetaceae bacterium]
MLVVQFLRWAYKVLTGEQRPWQIALGVAIGLAFGLIPFGFLTLAGLLLLLLINVHFGSGLFGLAIGLALGALLDTSLLYPLGQWVIEAGPHGLFLSLATSEVWSLLRLHENTTMGGLVAGIVAAPVVFVLVTIGVKRFRGPVTERFGKSKTLKALSNTFIIRGLRWLLVG